MYWVRLKSERVSHGNDVENGDDVENEINANHLYI